MKRERGPACRQAGDSGAAQSWILTDFNCTICHPERSGVEGSQLCDSAALRENQLHLLEMLPIACLPAKAGQHDKT